MLLEDNAGQLLIMSPATAIIASSEDSPTLPGSPVPDNTSQPSVALRRDVKIWSAQQGSREKGLKRKRSISSDGLEELAQLSRSEVEPAEEMSKDKVILDLQEEVRFLRSLKHQSDLQAVHDHNEAQQTLDELQEQIACPICKTNKVDVVATWCGHAFCESCILNGVDTTWETQCATCMARAGRKTYIPLYLI